MKLRGIMHKDGSSKPVAEKVKAAVRQAKEQYGQVPPVCLMHASEHAKLKVERGRLPSTLEVQGCEQILPFCYLAGWPEGASPPESRYANGVVRPLPESEQVLDSFQECLFRHQGRKLALPLGSPRRNGELKRAKTLVKQAGGLDMALAVTERFFTDPETSWQKPLSLSFVLTAAPSLLGGMEAEEEAARQGERQATASREELAQAQERGW